MYFLPSVGDHVAPQVSWSTKWITTFWASVVLHSTMGEHVRFQRASHTKWLVALDTIVCSFFAVSDYAPPQISCLIEWLNTCASCLHCWRRKSLNFDLVLLRSGTFNTVAFGKLEALYFELNVFQNLKKSFQAFTCLMFLLNLLQLFWTPKFMAT